MRILVTGAAGQLGQATVARLAPDHAVTAWARQDVDLTHGRTVRDAVRALAPEVILNCSAFNNVDGAEDQQQTALAVNALAVATLARAAADLDAVFFHYSTDFVFAGTAARPYTEQDPPEPQSVYAQSKLLGEWMAADAPRHYVLRVESLFGGPHGKSSTDKIIAAVRAGTPANVFSDRVVSPSFVADVVGASLHLLNTRAEYGLYHCVNSGLTTWLELGQEIARQLNRPADCLKAVSVHDVKLRASRPQYAALSNAKLAAAGYTMPTWQDSIARHLQAKVS